MGILDTEKRRKMMSFNLSFFSSKGVKKKITHSFITQN